MRQNIQKKHINMNLLLIGINAKYIHSNPAIYSIAAYAGRFTAPNGIPYKEQVQIAEYTINQNIEDILADIYLRKPDCIGFSCYIWNIAMVESLIEDIHQVMPQVPLWLGGPEVSFHSERLFERFPFLAGIIIGEGEKTTKEIWDVYLENDIKNRDSQKALQQLYSIPGICLKDGYTPERECMDLNEIPFLYEDLSRFENRIIYYESSRGCPFRCKYCLSSIEKQLRFRDTERVKKELQFFLDNKVPQVKFIDRTFNAKKEHSKAIWNYIKEKDNGITNFHFEISADLLDEEELDILTGLRPGLVQLEIGVQSTNEDTIAAINRTMNLKKLASNVKRLNEAKNVHLHLDLIAGLPYEDYVIFQKSFDEVYAMEPEQLQLGFLKVLKGSMMEEQAEEYGVVYRKEPPYEVLFTRWLSYRDVIKLKRVEAMVELFYNSEQFSHTIRLLHRRMGSAFSMYERLGDFYFEQGYLVMSSKRLAHYEHLLDFVKKYDAPYVDLYRELLTYDSYLREKNKTRPVFAKNLDSYKEKIRAFYKREEEERILLPYHKDYDSKQMIKMTHMDFFKYPVWKKDVDITDESQEEYAVLFDYSIRNPVTKCCRTENC